jgi:hypothetical protein
VSWTPQAITDSGHWAGNGLRFATKEEPKGTSPELPWYGMPASLNHPIRSTTAGRTGGSFVMKPEARSLRKIRNLCAG